MFVFVLLWAPEAKEGDLTKREGRVSVCVRVCVWMYACMCQITVVTVLHTCEWEWETRSAWLC